MNKPTVRFTRLEHCVVGDRADVWPLDHPDKKNVSNSTRASTSPVLRIEFDQTGAVIWFETFNTCYVRHV